jgi:hypothetical protein
MKETEKVMKQVDKEERRRSKQQIPSSSLFTKAAKGPLAATPPAIPKYHTLCSLMPPCIHELSGSYQKPLEHCSAAVWTMHDGFVALVCCLQGLYMKITDAALLPEKFSEICSSA